MIVEVYFVLPLSGELEVVMSGTKKVSYFQNSRS